MYDCYGRLSPLKMFSKLFMKSSQLLIHTNFHRNRTGVTRSIENVFPFFAEKHDAFIWGYGIKGPKISTRKLLKLVFRKEYFVLHCHRNNEVIAALFLRKLGGNFKLLFTRHAEAAPSGVTKYLLKKSDVAVALTKRMLKTLPCPATVVGHGVNQEVFNTKVDVNSLDFPQQKIILCAGRVREAKGQHVLLEVLAPILKNHPDWALAIVGKVDSQAFLGNLKKVAEENSVREQVYFIPETSDIVSFYRGSNTVVVPSFTEGFSLVCAEAMSCGCNVIATRDVGIHSELIHDCETGYLFDVNNKTELNQLLTKLLTNELPHLGKKAQKEVAENWSSKVEAQNLMKLYS